jgi:uncharacterized protein with PIN domain
MRNAITASVLVVAATASLLGATLAGVTMPDTVQVGGKTLTLNGLGLRSKMGFKVYVAGLYVESKVTDGEAVLGTDAPRRIVLHFLRDLDRETMVEAFTESFTANSSNAASMTADFGKMLGAFAPITAGDEWAFTYVPNKGTTLTVKGADKVTVPGQPFGRAMFACFLGPKPPSGGLKNGLLGK